MSGPARKPSGLGDDGTWCPAFPGQRAPFLPGNEHAFQPGHTRSLRHGARSPRKVGPLAAEITAGLLADPALPPWVRSPILRDQVEALARAEATRRLLAGFVTSDAEMPAWRRDAATAAWLRAESRASALAHRLGLTPMGYAENRAALASLADLPEPGEAEARAMGFTGRDAAAPDRSC